MNNLLLDLGNSRLKYWLTKNGTVTKHAAELHLQAPAELLLGLIDVFATFDADFIGVSSVLGKQTNAHVMASLERLDIPTEMVSVNAKHACMTSHYDANQLGVDRWLQMLAVADRYADTHPHLCVVGCGTALTIDLISHRAHLGGYILPSIYLQRESLQKGTRQISIADDTFASITAGTTTSDAVHRGILLSLVGAINEIINRNPDCHLVMTGGDAETIAQHLHRHADIHRDLLLKGMQVYFSHGEPS